MHRIEAPRMHGITEETDKKACTQRRYEISRQSLPLCCPPQDTRVWDAHPRVYLPIEEAGVCTCPYCGTVYALEGFTPPK